MPTSSDETPRHIVVFDCNVYLDVAAIVGQPFSWEGFDSAAASVAQDNVPHDDPAYDSLRAIAGCTSGRFAGNETLEVWTNAHIDKIVRGKAMQPTTPDAAGHKGLGWGRVDAQALVDELVHGLTSRSNGGTLGANYPAGNPPLDHEDGMVYGACQRLASSDPLASVYCVTRDRGFLDAYRRSRLDTHTKVLAPPAFVALFRKARTYYSIRRMTPP